MGSEWADDEGGVHCGRARRGKVVLDARRRRVRQSRWVNHPEARCDPGERDAAGPRVGVARGWRATTARRRRRGPREAEAAPRGERRSAPQRSGRRLSPVREHESVHRSGGGAPDAQPPRTSREGGWAQLRLLAEVARMRGAGAPSWGASSSQGWGSYSSARSVAPRSREACSQPRARACRPSVLPRATVAPPSAPEPGPPVPPALASAALPVAAPPASAPAPAARGRGDAGRPGLSEPGNDEWTSTGSLGVGPKRAEAILALRTKLGHFRQIEDLLKVKGIGRSVAPKAASVRAARPAAVRVDGRGRRRVSRRGRSFRSDARRSFTLKILDLPEVTEVGTKREDRLGSLGAHPREPVEITIVAWFR